MTTRYTAAIKGSGLWQDLKTCFASRFFGIRAIVLVPQEQEKLELRVDYDTRNKKDIVTLQRRNWSTGSTSVLYQGPLTGGMVPRPRIKKD